MATYEGIKILTMLAGEAFAKGSLHELVAISGGRVVKADGDAADLQLRQPVGILAVDAAAVGEAVTIVDLDGGGIAKVKVNAAVAQDAILVASNTPGKADDVAAEGNLAADQVAFGVALEAATAANEIISFKVSRMTAPHTA